ncbi:glucose 1-dehydrogenase [Lentilactobacillus parabuchneri]|uniref:glucose 1-dehydrogenase n=1 Tax=Lentilactobacillus parabuchneri TaxID=152331 RepID=UPI0022367922|nr:glucose 1-dehydrogenase [Lentilactobacillus parabuchneri]MCW4398563.1 glucose 1-dehydrogenase [Lentilactobacillus parabuchneri]
MARLDNKVAIITGGAKGIGFACAKRFVKEGAKVVVTDVDEEVGQKSIYEFGDSAIFIKQDVSKEADWQNVIKKAEAHFGHIDILLNNAGILSFNNAEEIDEKTWNQVLSVDLDGVMWGVKFGIAAMKENGGSIINLSSIAGLIGISNLYAYNAAKGGVSMLTKSAALYCAEKGYPIRVNSVHPGYVHTPMVDVYPEMRKSLEALHPMGRLAQPDEIANMVLYLASDESSFSTGSEFVVDGGYTAQ